MGCGPLYPSRKFGCLAALGQIRTYFMVFLLVSNLILLFASLILRCLRDKILGIDDKKLNVQLFLY